MPVSVERVQGFQLGFDDDPDMAGTIVAAANSYALALRANSAGHAMTITTRNGVPFSTLYNNAFGYGRFNVSGQVPSVGTFTAESSAGTFTNYVGMWVVFDDVNTSAPIGTVLTEEENGTGWTAPNLSPAGAAGDLLVSILMTNNWDSGYSSTASSVVSIGGSQTLLLDRPMAASPVVGEPRIIVTTAPIGSAMTYAFSGGAQPTYLHAAFAVKFLGGGPTPAQRASINGALSSSLINGGLIR